MAFVIVDGDIISNQAMGQEVIVNESAAGRIMPFIRIINILSGLMLLGFGLGGAIFMGIHGVYKTKFFLIFSPVCMIIGGLIYIVAEFRIMAIIKIFSFLQTLIGRGIFMIYMSASVYYYFGCGHQSNKVAGWVLAIIVFLMGLLYLFLRCCGGEAYDKEIEQKLAD